jgi:hypothetical protein
LKACHSWMAGATLRTPTQTYALPDARVPGQAHEGRRRSEALPGKEKPPGPRSRRAATRIVAYER